MKIRAQALAPWLVGWLASAVILYLRARPTWASTVDDAWISARYAANLVAGHGLLFSEHGPRVEGYTNLLWTLLLALGELVGANPHATMVGLGFAFGVASLAAIVGLTRALAPEVGLWALVPGFLLALDPNFAIVSTNGLETSQFVATLLAALWAFADNRRPWVTGLLLALLVLSRPEGIAAAGLISAAELWRSRRHLRERRTWIAPGAALATLLALEAFRIGTYGAWLPNTFEAKSFQSWDEKWRGNARYLRPGRPYFAAVIVAMMVGWLVPRRSLPKTVTVLVAVALVAIALQVFLWMPGARLLVPSTALGLALLGTSFAPLPRRGRWGLLAGLVLLVALGARSPLTRHARAYDGRHSALPSNGAERAARHLAAHAPAGSWLAVRDAGVFAYWVGPDIDVAEMHSRPLTQPYRDGEPLPWVARVPPNPELFVATTNREGNQESHYPTDRGLLASFTVPYVYLGRVEQHYHRYYDVYARADLGIPPLPAKIVVNRSGRDRWPDTVPVPVPEPSDPR